MNKNTNINNYTREHDDKRFRMTAVCRLFAGVSRPIRGFGGIRFTLHNSHQRHLYEVGRYNELNTVELQYNIIT